MRISDWSSDVCSSDLVLHAQLLPGRGLAGPGDRRGDHRLVLLAERRHLGVAIDGDRVAVVGHQRVQRLDQAPRRGVDHRSEEHTSELQSLMRTSYAVFCLKKKNRINKTTDIKTVTTHVSEYLHK